MGARCSFNPLCLCLLMCLFGAYVAVPGATANGQEGRALGQDVVQSVCSSTRYQAVCEETLRSGRQQGSSGLGQHADLVALLVEKTREETLLSTNKLPSANDPLGAMQTPKSLQAIGYCDELMEMSTKRLDQSLRALKSSFPAQSKADIQTWLSAVITFQDACKDSVNGAAGAGPLVSQVSSRMDHLSALASNALALANRLPDNPGRRLGESESDGAFPSWVSAEDRRLLEGDSIEPHAVVALDGSGDFLTIAEALEAVAGGRGGKGRRLQGGGGRKVISIKAGVYKQKFTVSDDNVMLVGEGKGSTIISGSSSVGGGASMPGSATAVVKGDNFVAKDIGFENTAGADNHQALALLISSDHAVLYHCLIRGHQDTLYAMALRQFYRECDIYGSIDYIFGNAAAVFQSCNLLFQQPHHKGINTVTAHGRSDPGQNTGFSIQGCNIGAGPELAPVKGSVKSYLGRPWKAYARVVVMQSRIDDSLQPSGWSPWSGGFGLKTLYYGEYQNSGPGAGTSGRVNWPGFHIMGTADASKFTVASFISGTSWIPSTGASFDPGL